MTAPDWWGARFADELDARAEGGPRFRRDEDDLLSLLRRRAAEHPGRAFVVDSDGGDRLTYEETLSRVEAIAADLARRCEPGSHVLVLGTVTSGVALAALGVLAAGCVPALASERLPPPELHRLCEQVRPRLVLAENPYAIGGWAGPVVAFEHLVRGGHAPAAAPGPADWAFLLPTGGTTGAPKLVVLTHENVTQNLSFFRLGLRVPEVAVALVATPLFHVTGLMAQLLHMLDVGGTCVLMRRFDPVGFCDAAERHGATFACLVPAMLRMILMELEGAGRDLPGFHTILYGGAPMDPNTVARIGERMPGTALVNTYGATETSGSVTFMPPELLGEDPLAVGLASPVAEIGFVPVERDVVDESEWADAGLVSVTGRTTSPGYLAWDGDHPTTTGSGKRPTWLSSDVGARRGALLHVLGRGDDVINRGGEKVHPVEIERALLEHPDVAEAVAWGEPDEILGAQVAAAVVLRADAELEECELRDFARGALSGHKVPARLRFVSELPRTPAGKIDRRALAARQEV